VFPTTACVQVQPHSQSALHVVAHTEHYQDDAGDGLMVGPDDPRGLSNPNDSVTQGDWEQAYKMLLELHFYQIHCSSNQPKNQFLVCPLCNPIINWPDQTSRLGPILFLCRVPIEFGPDKISHLQPGVSFTPCRRWGNKSWTTARALSRFPNSKPSFKYASLFTLVKLVL